MRLISIAARREYIYIYISPYHRLFHDHSVLKNRDHKADSGTI